MSEIGAGHDGMWFFPITPVELSGPVAGHPPIDTPIGSVPKGTVNNCANGYTPRGAYLTCEENFNGYFGATAEGFETEERDRYGFSSEGFGYNWYNFDERWDSSNPDHQNEEHRFGWIVEVDPMDLEAAPAKRTALGRVKHEGIALAVGAGARVRWLHRRRSTLRLHLQVRVGSQLEVDAGGRHQPAG